MKIFERFKNKAFVVWIIKALLVGCGAGFLVAGVLLLLNKLEISPIGGAFPWLIGALVLALAGVGAFFLIKVNDKALAKTLDRQFGLQEKVQTMLVHKDSQGAIYELQRQDANLSLENARGKRLDLKWLWVYIVCFTLGLAMLITSLIFTHVKEEEPPKPEVPFELGQLQEAALNELVAYIEASTMQEPYKTNVKAAVVDLITGLKLSKTEKERDICLDLAIETILKQTDDSSCALELMTELWACNTATTRALAKALNYYDWPRLDEWDKYTDTAADFRALFIYVAQADTEPTEEDKVNFLKALLNDTSIKILTSLPKSGLSEEDELYLILVRLANANEVDNALDTKTCGLSTLAENIDTLGYTETERSLDDTMLAYNSIIFKALSQHKTNTDTGEYAITRICDLFGYTLPKLERPVLIETSVDSGDDSSGGGGGGAIGGGTTFGSDDLVFDPNTGEYVEYGTILSRYYAIMFGKTEAGVYTEEEKAALEKYFSILQDGFPEENEE
ncbi:MAG: hypothetical protein IJ309_05235 [Clostridia bacterium]|nr:hypothetical protein [Clostridia bacterium]